MATAIGGGNGSGGSAATSTTVDLTSVNSINWLTIEVASVLSTAWLRFYRGDRRTPTAAIKQRLTIGGTEYVAQWLHRNPILFSALGGGTVAQECGSLIVCDANTQARIIEVCIPYAELGLATGAVKLTNWQALDAIVVYP